MTLGTRYCVWCQRDVEGLTDLGGSCSKCAKRRAAATKAEALTRSFTPVWRRGAGERPRTDQKPGRRWKRYRGRVVEVEVEETLGDEEPQRYRVAFLVALDEATPRHPDRYPSDEAVLAAAREEFGALLARRSATGLDGPVAHVDLATLQWWRDPDGSRIYDKCKPGCPLRPGSTAVLRDVWMAYDDEDGWEENERGLLFSVDDVLLSMPGVGAPAEPEDEGGLLFP